MSANNNKRIQSIDCRETYTFGASGNIIRKNDETIQAWLDFMMRENYRKKQERA